MAEEQKMCVLCHMEEKKERIVNRLVKRRIPAYLWDYFLEIPGHMDLRFAFPPDKRHPLISNYSFKALTATPDKEISSDFLSIICDLSYRCENEFSKHYNKIHRFGCDLCSNKSTHNMLLEDHIKNHHKPDSVPTVVGRDKKHVKENNDNETNENNADVQIYVKEMSNEENSNGVDKKIDIEERDTIRKVAIPYRIAYKNAELKPRKNSLESLSYQGSYVTNVR